MTLRLPWRGWSWKKTRSSPETKKKRLRESQRRDGPRYTGRRRAAQKRSRSRSQRTQHRRRWARCVLNAREERNRDLEATLKKTHRSRDNSLARNGGQGCRPSRHRDEVLHHFAGLIFNMYSRSLHRFQHFSLVFSIDCDLTH